MSGSENPLLVEQSTSAKSVGIRQMEEQANAGGELALSSSRSAQHESVALIRVAGDDPTEDREVV